MSTPVLVISGRFNERIVQQNLAKVIATFRDAGAARFVIGGVVETPSDVDAIRDAIPAGDITICRLVAPQQMRETWLERREPGAAREWHLKRTVELDRILDAIHLEDFTVENGGRPVREVALEVLRRAKWSTVE